MPQPDDARKTALRRLDDRLDAFDARHGRGAVAGAPGSAEGKSLSEAYRLVASLIGGLLTGLGAGWLLDRLAGTSPWGLIGGLLIGAGVSITAVIRLAARISDRATETGYAKPVPDDDEDE
jgi:ATP synthase protein I